MAKDFTTYFNGELKPQIYVPGPIIRNNASPLDCSDIFLSETDAEKYATGDHEHPDERGYFNKAYGGQIIGVRRGITEVSGHGYYSAYIVQGDGTITRLMENGSREMYAEEIRTSSLIKEGAHGIIGDDLGNEFDEVHTQLLHLCGKTDNGGVVHSGRVDFGTISQGTGKGVISIEHMVDSADTNVIALKAPKFYITKSQLTCEYDEQQNKYVISGGDPDGDIYCGTIRAYGNGKFNSIESLGTIGATGTVTGKVNNQYGVVLGVPVGSIIMWPTDDIPDGWLLCNGDYIDNTQTGSPNYVCKVTGSNYYYKATNNDYRNLVKIIADKYGHVGTPPAGLQKIQLPDLQGHFVVGATGTASNPGFVGSYSAAIGVEGGEATHVLTKSEMPEHTHDLNYNVANDGGDLLRAYGSLGNTTGTGTRTTTTELEGNGSAHNNIPPFIALNYIIKYK